MIDDITRHKLRSDAWDAGLTDEQRWQCYDKCRAIAWYLATQYIQQEYGERISRGAYYRWLTRMRSMEGERRLGQAREAAMEAAAIAKGSPLADDITAEAYKAMAIEAAIKTDAKTAAQYVQMAVAISSRALKRQELELRARAQEIKEQELKLAQDKFAAAEARLNAVKAAVSADLSPEERERKIKDIFGI